MTPHKSIIQSITLEQTLETIPSGLFVVDKKGHIIYWNPAAERIAGFSSEDIIGKHCSFLQGFPCQDMCGLYNDDIAKPILDADCTIVTKSGETVHLLKNMDYLRNSEGEIIGGIESFTDITRQHDLEGSLREQAATLEARIKARTVELKKSEQRFRTVLDNMDDMAYITTEDYKLTFMNRAMLDIFGDQVGKNCYTVLHNETMVCPWCPMNKIFNHRTVRDERPLGTHGKMYEVIHSYLPAENGVRRKLAVCRDITERKRTETDLREANRELDAFAHSISHDLRGILSPVVTYMDFLRINYKDVLDEQILEILGEVEHQSERAIALLDDLLDLAQVGHMQPGKYPTDVNMIINEIINELALENTAPLEIKSNKLPKSWVPETLVYQIFINLLGNAQRYVPAEKGPVEVGCWDEDQVVTYFVRDHGPGVTNQEKEDIFDIFYRGKSSLGQRGTGVGLAIVRKIALRCQGETWVEQTPGGGSTFCISLPKKPTFGNQISEDF